MGVSDILDSCNCISNSKIATIETMLHQEKAKKETYEFKHQIAVKKLIEDKC